jgi:hypothetical protein
MRIERTAVHWAGWEGAEMTDRAEEKVEALGDQGEWTVRAAAGVAMIGLLIGLCAVFIGLAPGV